MAYLTPGQRQALSMTVADYERPGFVEDDYRIDDGQGFDNDAATIDAQEDDLGGMSPNQYDPFDSYAEMEFKGLGEVRENMGRLAALHDCACAKTGVGGVLSDLFGLGDAFDPTSMGWDPINTPSPTTSSSGGFWDSVLSTLGAGATTAANAGIKRIGQEIAGGPPKPALPTPRSTIFGVPTLYVGIAGAALVAFAMLRKRRS